MEINIKGSLWKNGESKALKSIERITKKLSVIVPNTSIKNIPYDTTEERRVNKLDFDRKISYALAESQRMRSRKI